MRRPASEDVEREIAALDGLDRSQLQAMWEKLHRRAAPSAFRRNLLIRSIAYQLQSLAFGALAPKTHRRLLKIAAAVEDGSFDPTTRRRLRPGTRLVRAWKGTTHSINVLDDGFEWQGERYRSLSAIARAISGTNWNGNSFFGLKPHKRSTAAPATSAEVNDG